jgi:hypothetical protein
MHQYEGDYFHHAMAGIVPVFEERDCVLTLGLSGEDDSLSLPHENQFEDEDGFPPSVTALQLVGAARTLLLWR